MRYVLFTLLGLLCLGLTGATFLLVAGPSDLMREQVAHLVKAHTGRDLTIQGASSFTVFPQPGIALTDAVLSDPPELGGAPFVRVARLEAVVPYAALLGGRGLGPRLAVERVILHGAVVDLRVDAQGRRNWDMPGAIPTKRTALPVRLASLSGTANGWPNSMDDAGAVRLAQAPSPPAPSPASLDVTAPAVSRIEIVGGAISYANAVTGSREDVTGVDLQADFAKTGADVATGTGGASAGGADLRGQGTWRGEPVQLQGAIGSLRGLMQEGSPVTIRLTAKPGELQFEGTATTAGGVGRAGGSVKTQTASARDLVAWINPGLGQLVPIAALAAAPGPVVVTAKLSAQPDQILVQDLVATHDGATLRGTLSVATDGPRPLLRGEIGIDRLDLSAMSGRLAAGAAVPAVTTPSVAPPSPNAGRKPSSDSITDLIEKMDGSAPSSPKPATNPGSGNPASGKAAPQVRGWSSAAIDLRALRTFDAEIKLDAGALITRDFTLGRTRVTTTLRGGLLKAVFTELELYKGRGSGTLDLDAAAPRPRLALQATITGVDVQPLLKAVAGLDRIAGQGRLVLALAGEGRAAHEIVGSLSGTAAVTVMDGAVFGANVQEMMRKLQRGQMPPPAAASDKTEFSELIGTFQVAGGIAQTQDLKIVSSVVRVTGAGTIDLGRELLDLQLKPKLVANGNPAPGSGAGPGAGLEQVLANLDIPVQLRGSWASPKATVDLNHIMKDPNGARKAVEQIGEVLKSKEGKEAVGNVLRNLFGR